MTTSPLLRLPGAVAGVDADEGVAAHYGNPLAEQRTLVSGRALVDLSHRAVLTITGEDRLSWLHSMSSQDVGRLAPGESAETLLLDQNGHIEFALRIVDDGTALWIVTECSCAASLLEFLQRMRFMLRVEPADRSDEFAVIGTLGLGADVPGEAYEAMVAAVGEDAVRTWRDPWPGVCTGGFQYATTSTHPGSSWWWAETIVPRDRLGALADVVRRGDARVAGTLAAEALRIEAWRPRWATEVDEKSVPHELDWLRTAVHLSKGCYRGQETVAKLHNLGHPPRRLVLLQLDGSASELPAPGAELSIHNGDESAVVGRVTSSGMHYELGPIALAVVKRKTDPDAVLHTFVNGFDVAGAQEIIVPPDAGSVANVPRLPRLGAVTRPPRR